MYNGGHSRHSYPLDKHVPKFRSKFKRAKKWGNDCDNFANTSTQREVVRAMHKVKQRQHDRRLEQGFEEGENV